MTKPGQASAIVPLLNGERLIREAIEGVLAQAKGEHLSFLDADDVMLPHKLDEQVRILTRSPEIGMVYGASQWWYSWTG
jgi:hypothetical protein